MLRLGFVCPLSKYLATRLSDYFYKSSFFLNYSTLLYEGPTAEVGEFFWYSRLISTAFA